MDKQSSIDVLYDIAIERLQNQIKRIDGADTKIGIIFGLTNGLAAALGAFVVLLQGSVTWLVFIFIVLSGFSYIFTLILLYFAYRWGKWSFRPDIETLRGICTSSKYHDFAEVVKEWIADECILSINSNKEPLSQKVRIANNALKVLSAQGIFLVVSYVLFVLV